MTRARQYEITFSGLQRFLCDIGFDRTVKLDNCLVLHHGKSGTMITLAIPRDRRTVRAADLLSVAMRLDNAGIVGEVALEQLKSGKLPQAA